MSSSISETFVITEEQNLENAFLVGVNHLSLGQIEACFALLKASSSITTENGADGSTLLASLIRSFMRRFSSGGGRVPRTPVGVSSSATSGTSSSEVQLHSSFRVVSSSIAPCVESMIFAVANTPGACDTSIWWDDELVVLVNVIIHAAANMFHTRFVSSSVTEEGDATNTEPHVPRNVAVIRNELLHEFDFLLEHDPEQFGVMDFEAFVSIFAKFDVLWRRLNGFTLASTVQSGQDDSKTMKVTQSTEGLTLQLTPEDALASDKCMCFGEARVATEAFDSLMAGIWSLTSCYFSVDDYRMFFAKCSAEWKSFHQRSPRDTLPRSPFFVARVLSACSSSPPTAEDSSALYQAKLDVRRQRMEDVMRRKTSGEAPVTFSRASYLKRTETGLNSKETEERQQKAFELNVASDLFCAPVCHTEDFSTFFFSLCSKHRALHRLGDAFAQFQQSQGIGGGATNGNDVPAVLRSVLPLQNPRESLYQYSTGLLSFGQGSPPRDVLTCVTNSVISFLCMPAPGSIGGSGTGTALSSPAPQLSIFSTLRSIFHSPVLEAFKPYACFELYGRKCNRDLFRNTQLTLSLHDHELLIDFFTTQASGASSLLNDHPCAAFVHGLRLAHRLSSILEKQLPRVYSATPTASSGVGTSSSAFSNGSNTNASGNASLRRGHILLLDLLDSKCNVVDLLLTVVSGDGSSSGDVQDTVTSSSTEDQQTMSSRIQSMLPSLLSVLISCRNGPECILTPALAASVERQLILLRGVSLLKFVSDRLCANSEDTLSSTGGLNPSIAQGFDESVRQYATAALTVHSAHVAFARNLTELLVELVVSMSAQEFLTGVLTTDDARLTSTSAASVVGSTATGTTVTPAKRRAGTDSVITTPPQPRRRGLEDNSSAPITTASSALRSLTSFCIVVSTLKAHLSSLLAEDVRCLLQDIVFRASHTEGKANGDLKLLQDYFQSLSSSTTTTTTATSSALLVSKESSNAFSRSPYRFLLEATLSSDTPMTDIEDVLLHLFSFPESTTENELRHVHPVLAFTFLSTRLRALRSGTLSLSTLLSHFDWFLSSTCTPPAYGRGSTGDLESESQAKSPISRKSTGSAIPSAPTVNGAVDKCLLRTEELWFHSPSRVAAELECNPAFLRTYQQSILSTDAVSVDIRVVSKRFEEVMASMTAVSSTSSTPSTTAPNSVAAANPSSNTSTAGGAVPSAQVLEQDRAAFHRYLSATEDVKCSPTALESYLKSIDRMSRVSCSASANAEDLIPLLNSVSTLLKHDANKVWCPVFSPHPNAGCDELHRPVSIPAMIGRVKELSDVIRQYVSTQPSLPDVIREGHALIFQAATSGVLTQRLPYSLSEAADVGLLSLRHKQMLLRIILCEFCIKSKVLVFNRNATSQQQTEVDGGTPLTPEQELHVASVVDCLVSPSAAIAFVYLFCSQRSWELLEEQRWVHRSDTTADNTSWIRRWFAGRCQILQVLQKSSSAAMMSKEDLSRRLDVADPLPRAQLLFSPEAAFAAGAEVLTLLCSDSNCDERRVLSLCEELPLPFLMSSLDAISVPEEASSVRETIINVVIRHMTTLRAQQILAATSLATVQVDAAGKSLSIPSSWCIVLEELVMSSLATLTIVSCLVPSAAASGGDATVPTSAVFLLHSVLPYTSQRRMLEQVLRRVAVELHCDSEDDSLRRTTQRICQRMEQISLCLSLQESMNRLTAARSGAPLAVAARVLLLDPIPLDLAVPQYRATDDELRQVGEQCNMSRKAVLEMRAKHLTLMRANCNEAVLLEIVGSLSPRYSDILRLVREEELRKGSNITRADFMFMKELSSLIKSELSASPTTSGTLIQRLVDTLLNANDLSMDLVFRIIRFVTESSLTKKLFSEQSKWRYIAVGLQLLHALTAYETAVTVEDAMRAQGGSATSEPPVQLSNLFDRSFISHPLLIIENLLMAQRISTAASLIAMLQGHDDMRQACDTMLLRYARRSVDLSRYDTIDASKFPNGKSLDETVNNESAPPLLPPKDFSVMLMPEDSTEQLDKKRARFHYQHTPNLPVFRRMVRLCSDQEAVCRYICDYSMALFDSIGDYDNHVVRVLAIDTAEQLLQCATLPCVAEEQRRMLHWLQISRHLVVCKWTEHPKREDLESEEGVITLITNLLEEGHNKGAYSIAEVCHLDLHMIHSIWASRTTHLLSLGLFEEAATTLSVLPAERIREILSTVFEAIECTPMPVGYRAVAAGGSYSVKQFTTATAASEAAAASATASEVQSLINMRRIGVRSLLTRFGSPSDVMAFSVRSMDFAQVFPIVVQLKKEEDVIIRDVYAPVENMQCIDAFRKAMLQFDPSLEKLRFLLIIVCKHLEGRQEYEQLLGWQSFMCDYSRAAQTSVLLATLPTDRISNAQRLTYLNGAEKFLIEAKFQPTSKQAPAQYSDDGVLLPLTRMDGQQLSNSLVQCRLQKDLWTLLQQNNALTDAPRYSLYGEQEHLVKVVVDVLMLGKTYFEVATKSVTNLGVNVQHVFSPVALQLLRIKKHDMVEQLAEYIKKNILLSANEKNAILLELLKGCVTDSQTSASAKKSLKLCDTLLDCMTAEGGHKARGLLLLQRWADALNEALASKEKQVILDLYEKVSAASPQNEETMHVANGARQYLARNNLRV